MLQTIQLLFFMKKLAMDMVFDFHEWASLAETDPEAFELRRLQYIELFLNRTGKHKHRLEQLQSTIDATNRLSNSAPLALVSITKLLIQSLADLSDQLTTLEHLARCACEVEAPIARTPPRCKVIPFPQTAAISPKLL